MREVVGQEAPGLRAITRACRRRPPWRCSGKSPSCGPDHALCAVRRRRTRAGLPSMLGAGVVAVACDRRWLRRWSRGMARERQVARPRSSSSTRLPASASTPAATPPPAPAPTMIASKLSSRSCGPASPHRTGTRWRRIRGRKARIVAEHPPRCLAGIAAIRSRPRRSPRSSTRPGSRTTSRFRPTQAAGPFRLHAAPRTLCRTGRAPWRRGSRDRPQQHLSRRELRAGTGHSGRSRAPGLLPPRQQARCGR